MLQFPENNEYRSYSYSVPFSVLHVLRTKKSEIKAASQKIVIPTENRHNNAFSFGTKIFWGTVSISDFTVYAVHWS